MKLFNLSLQLNGFPIKKATHLLNSVQNKSKLEFEAYLEVKKKGIVSYHLKHNPFYRSFGTSLNVSLWNHIPVMTKAHLQQALEDRLSDGFNKKNVYVNKTSGSSGDPFVFAKDKFCHALTWANFTNRYAWFDIDLNTSKQARFYGIPLDNKGFYKEHFKDKMSNRFRFSVFDLSDEQLEKNLNIFKSSSFDYINGYTSAIVQFAKFLERKNINLKLVCPSLQACIVTSEMLFETDKMLLEFQLGIPIINEYGAAELGLIAFMNHEKQWVVNNEDLYIEILDENNKVLPYGEEGRIVITSLYNKAHPFIRYDLGDIGVLSKQSTPQKPILEKLTGRTNDIVLLPSGKKATGLTFYYVTKTAIGEENNVKEFIIEQLNINTFKISYVSLKELSHEKLNAIKMAVFKYLEPNLVVLFERKSKLHRSNRGKLKQFKSYL